MKFLTAEIGSAKDNLSEPIHNWYRFTAGFSHKFVSEIIQREGLKKAESPKIFDPFSGCGTTLVSAQKAGISAVGNEGQAFMFDVIRAKLNWTIDAKEIEDTLIELRDFVINSDCTLKDGKAKDLLKSVYSTKSLKDLVAIKDFLESISSRKNKLFLKLALSQTLHRTSFHPIAIPYIVRSKTQIPKPVWSEFKNTVEKMLADLKTLTKDDSSSKVYLHDSRKVNSQIDPSSCGVCITSPPYLNNLDYGEISKIHTHFFGLTSSWGDITEKVRKKLVTSATTHYRESDFDIDKFKEGEFAKLNKNVVKRLEIITKSIKAVSPLRAGKKSFDILTMLYFQDMYQVLKEIDRVLSEQGKAFLILGDSAPYGNFIPTTQIIGSIAKSLNFNEYRIHKIRSRGSKWKDLRFRHSLPLSENLLILKK